VTSCFRGKCTVNDNDEWHFKLKFYPGISWGTSQFLWKPLCLCNNMETKSLKIVKVDNNKFKANWLQHVCHSFILNFLMFPWALHVFECLPTFKSKTLWVWASAGVNELRGENICITNPKGKTHCLIYYYTPIPCVLFLYKLFSI